MKRSFLSFISFVFLCLSASQALAGIRPSFDLETCSWHASDIVVATEGKKIDGVFRVLESWKGDLSPGDTIKISELASFAPESARVVSDPAYQKEKSPRFIVTGDRVILFLIRDSRGFMPEPNNGRPRSSASIKWESADFYHDFNVSVVWIEQGKSFGFVQVMNPGPSLLISLGVSEDEVKNRALEINDIQKSFLQTVSIADPARRAAALEPFAHHSLYQARVDAFEQLEKCGKAALAVLRRMLADDSLVDIHAQLVGVLSEAGKKDAGPDLAALIERDLEYWKRTGPVLQKGWWNGEGFDSLAEVEPLRDRYSRTYYAIDALRKRPYPGSEAMVRDVRELWRSLPQLEEIDQMSKACDEALRELDRLKANTNAVRFEGLHTIDESALMLSLREKGLLVRDDSSNTPDVIEKAKTGIRDYLASRGHMHAEVTGEFDPASRVLRFVIDEGKRARVAEIGFEGNKVFSTGQLREQMQQCLARYEDDDDYDADKFDYCMRKLDNFARSLGYLHARFHDPETKETEDGLVFTIHVDEGILYRLGKMTIEGSSFFSPEELRAVIGLQEGDIANGEKLGEAFYGNLKKQYGTHGFIEYTAELNPTFKDNPQNTSGGIVDFEVMIDEGKQFKIHSINFWGTNLARQRLLDILLIREGDIFNQELYEKSIQKLNESGLLEPIVRDSNVDFKTDEAKGVIDLLIKVGGGDRNLELKEGTLKLRQPEPPQ